MADSVFRESISPFRATFREELFGSGANIATIIDQRDLERRLVAQENGASHGYALWAVWALERWLQQTRHHVAEQPVIVGSSPSDPAAAINA